MAPTFDRESRFLLWTDHASALRFAEARWLLFHRRQVLRGVLVNQQRMWHVQSAVMAAEQQRAAA